MSYFENFPLVDYANNSVRNILSRVQFSQDTLNNDFILYPYTVKEGQRADTLSYNYYNNSKHAWLVWLSNQIVDPYYQFPVSTDDFNQTIKAMYGTIERAQRIIVGFTTNWREDPSSISVSQYNSLPASVRKYWMPEYDVNFNVFGYVRSDMNLSSSTNAIVQINTRVASSFIEGEIIQKDSSNYATVISSNQTTVFVQHVIGQFLPEDIITGTVSEATATITEVQTAQQVIPLEEYVYWTPVTAYQYHEQIALDRRNIRLLSSTYRSAAERQLFDLLNYK